MKKMINYMGTGIGIGAFAYLITLVHVQGTSPRAILGVLTLSALIGLTAMIYEVKTLALGQRWGIHLLCVLSLLAVMLLDNGWFNLTVLAWTTAAYAIIFWGLVLLSGGRHA